MKNAPLDFAQILTKGYSNLSEEEKMRLVKELLLGESDVAYNRILSPEEKEVLTMEAHGFLLHMLALKSIDEIQFEKMLGICQNMQMFIRKPISKKIVERILEIIVFSPEDTFNIREFIEFIIKNPDDFLNEDPNNLAH